MVRLGRRYRFSASHRLHAPQLTDEQNREVFGKCNNPFGHGHDYTLEVTFRGHPDPRTGLLLNLDEVDRRIREDIVGRFDHKFMNAEIDAFRDTPPTTENVATEIARRLYDLFSDYPPRGVHVDGVQIFETRRNRVSLEIR